VRALWLPDVLTAAGCKVRTIDGWQNRGKELVSIEGVVWHHTASGPSSSDAAVAGLLTKGRPDLAGPLAQLGLQRDGTFVVVAAGKANHNGYGTWGNQALGIEAYNDGVGEPWPQAQLDAYDLGSAAILAHLGYDADRMKGHRETDPRRKPDPVGIDLDAARTRIARLLTSGLHPQPPKGPLMALTDEEQTEILIKIRELHDDYAVSIEPGSKHPRTGIIWPDGTKRWQIGKLFRRAFPKRKG